jgi:hypothetical protein
VIDFKKGHPLPLMSASMGALILLCLTACAHMGEIGDTPKLTFKGRKILVMPMRDMAQIYGENKSVISPLTGKYFMTGMVMEGSETLLTDELVTFIKDRPDYLYFPISQGEGEAATRMINLSAGALATSGDAKRFLLKDGVRYSHILDPTTGWPVLDSPHAVTVAAGSCLEAGMLATLAMLKGAGAESFLKKEKARCWVQRGT